MLPSFVPRRAFVATALLGLLALIALLATVNQPTAAHAKEETYGTDVQSQVIAGSRLRVVVYDQGFQQPWTGKVNGPGGVIFNWDAPQHFGDASTVLYKEDLEAGNYTVVPNSTIAPGWHVAAYLARANIDPSGACATNGSFVANAFNSSPTVNLNAQDHSWVICVGVVRDGGIWASRVGVRFVTAGPAGNWLGALVGPQNVTYPLDDLIGSNYGGVAHGVLPGSWTVYPGSEPQPGYTVIGYYHYEMNTLSPNCPADPAAYTNVMPTVTVSDQHPNWAICVRIAPAVANSTLWVQVVGSGTIIPWSGNVLGPSSFQRTFASMGLGAGGNSALIQNLTPGTWTVAPAAIPAPGYQVLGFYITDGGSQTLCPQSPASYSSQNSFQVNDQHPNKYVCILMSNPTIVQNSLLAMSIVAPGNGPTQDWSGMIDGPGTFDWTWKGFGIAGPNYSSNQYSVGAGTYKFLSGTPVRPGWVVTGFAQVEIPNQPFPTCPQSAASYSPVANTVTISEQHPRGAMCVRIEKAPPPTVTPEPSVTFEPPIFESGWPEQPTSTPTVAKPSGTVSSGTPTPIGTSTPTPRPERDGGQGTNGDTRSDSDGSNPPTQTSAPLPPNTGTGGDKTSGDSMIFVLALGLMAAAALIVAANQLPVRTKR